MGSSVAKIVAPVAGAALGNLFGKKQKDPSAAAAAAASSMPSQTPEQREASQFLLPTLKDWMVRPPQLPFRAYTPTTINVAFGGTNVAERPAVQPTPVSTGSYGSAPASSAQTVSTQSVAARPSNPNAGWGYTPGKLTTDYSNINSAKAALDSARADYDRLMQQMSALSQQAQKEQQDAKQQLQQWYEQNWRYYRNHNSLGQTYAYPPYMVGMATPTTAAQQQMEALKSQLGAANERLSSAQAAYDRAIQSGPAQSYTPGSIQIADMPIINPLFGTVGAYQPNPDYSPLVGLTMTPPEPSWFGYQSMFNPATSRLLRNMSAPLSQQPEAGYREDASAGAPLTTDKFLPYENPLERTAESRIVSNLDREVREGYDRSYLADLAAQGLDPLRESYDLALKKASADFNRAGLGSSGFELLGKYGSQPDSITSRFLQEAGNVAREIGLRGAEAAREDRFRNAALRDQALAMAAELAGRQSSDQFQRLSGDLQREIAERNLMSDARQRNEAARQFWAQFGREGELANRGLAKAAFEGLTNLMSRDIESQKYWNEDDLRRQQLANANILTGVDTLSKLGQVDESNRQWWANLLDAQQRYDDAQRWLAWNAGLDLMKYLAARDDQAALQNLATQARLDQANLVDIPSAAISNLLSYIAGQGGAAQNMANNYRMAYEAALADNQRRLQQNAAIGGLFSDLFSDMWKKK